MNEYVTCTIATTMMMLLFGNLGNFSKEYKYSRYIEEIGRSTLPIYAIHWCILFAPNLNQNMYTRILNEDYYIFNVFFYVHYMVRNFYFGNKDTEENKSNKDSFSW